MPNPYGNAVILLQEEWRNRLTDAKSRFHQSRTPEDKRDYLRLLRQFTRLVMDGKCPDSVPVRAREEIAAPHPSY